MCRRSLVSSGRAGVSQGVCFRVVDADGLVEAGQLEDLAVVVRKAMREDALVLALRPHEQRDEQPDAATVHVLEAGEVEHDRLHTLPARTAVRVHQYVLALSRDVSLDV